MAEIVHWDVVDNEWHSGQQYPVMRVSLLHEQGRAEFDRLYLGAQSVGDYRWVSDVHDAESCPWKNGPAHLQAALNQPKETYG